MQFQAPSVPPPGKPEPERQVDTGKRYDVYCIEPTREVVVYRNALFKDLALLLPSRGSHVTYHEFVELEQANGQPIFISRTSIFRFCEPGTKVIAELVNANKPDAR